MLIGALLLVAGIVLIVWGAERFTDGALGAARVLRVSAFWIGAVVSGFEPENLATGIAAAAGALPQIALGTVVGSAVFMLTAGLGLACLIVPMDVRIPRAGPLAMLASLLVFGIALGDGVIGRGEGAVLAVAAIGLMAWLWRRSAAFPRAPDDADAAGAGVSAVRALAGLALGLVVIVIGAELLVAGARKLVTGAGVSETFLGMVVVGLGESVEETARMVAPARRGHPELALGNVVGTLIVLLLFNAGVIALVRPLVADPLVLRLHAPYLAVAGALVAAALLVAPRLDRRAGATLVALYLGYLAINLRYVW